MRAMQRWLLLLLSLSLRVHCSQTDTYQIPDGPEPDDEIEVNLRRRLLANYKAASMPRKSGEVLTVDLGVTVVSLISLDQITSTYRLNMWLKMRWFDSRLSWQPRMENGKCVSTASDDLPCFMPFSTYKEYVDAIWTPDLNLYNAAEKPFRDLSLSQAVVYHTGEVQWKRPGTISGICKFMLEDFPSDVQNCHIEIGSWSVPMGVIKTRIDGFYNPTFEIHPTSYIENEEWNFEYSHSAIAETLYECCRDPFQVTRLYFRAARKPRYYNQVFIMPALALAGTIVLSFGIPWNSGERVNAVIMLLLTLVVFLVGASKQLPKTDQGTYIVRVLFMLLYGCLFFASATIVWVKTRDWYQTKKDRDFRQKQLEIFKEQVQQRLQEVKAAAARGSLMSIGGTHYSRRAATFKVDGEDAYDHSHTSSMSVLSVQNTTTGMMSHEDTRRADLYDLKEVTKQLTSLIGEMDKLGIASSGRPSPWPSPR
eukprot:TRINITY_DN27308_c0_g1_i1.p1 TRINITY_DN27308_c0_g1~~TRINITY_DN27308_c0_g1_i1.p1  ORF type:complete len:480 (+),score=68.38 TRINITY_DN27308_c0_g1_i1:109-1548(+)